MQFLVFTVGVNLDMDSFVVVASFGFDSAVMDIMLELSVVTVVFCDGKSIQPSDKLLFFVLLVPAWSPSMKEACVVSLLIRSDARLLLWLEMFIVIYENDSVGLMT
jgi:hypothetical protein